MSNQKVSNEQIDQKLNLVLEHLKFHEKRFDSIDRKIEESQSNMDTQFKEVKSDIAGLKNTRLTWSTLVLAGVTMASSIITLILLRLLSWIGVRLVEVPSYFV